MKASLLTIGDELLIGQVLNSNAQWISERLTEIGCEVTHHLTVGDDEPSIVEGLNFLLRKNDVLIIGGGLGPTHDDITLEVLSRYFKTPLEHDSVWLGEVEKMFKARNRVMTDNNRKQALLLKDAVRIDNDCGTAAGQYLLEGKTHVFVVPGVPHEVKSMMTRFILPRLTEAFAGEGLKIRKATLLTTGMGESALAARLDPFVKKIAGLKEVTLAFLPNLATVRLRLQMTTRSAEDELLFEQLVEELKEGCGKDYFAIEPETIENVVIQTLIQKGASLAIAESCTGGLISHRLTQIPGSSQVLRGALVPYQEILKGSELGITGDFLASHGVVSEGVARAMAERIRSKWTTDYGLAITGYLGPGGGDSFAGIGTVWVALSSPNGTVSREFRYETNRERSKERAAQSAIDLLRRSL